MDNKFFLREKRCEYMLKLEEIVTLPFLNGITQIYARTKKECKQGKNILKEFQGELRNIKEWDDKVLKEVLKRFREESKCEFIEKLITSIFKIYYLTNGIKEAHFPSVKKYIHECYLNIARKLFKNPYLVYDVGVTAIERRKNIHAIEGIIRKCINDTFVQMLPFSPIDVYENDVNSDDGNSEDERSEDEGSEDERSEDEGSEDEGSEDEEVPGDNEAAEEDTDEEGEDEDEDEDEEDEEDEDEEDEEDEEEGEDEDEDEGEDEDEDEDEDEGEDEDEDEDEEEGEDEDEDEEDEEEDEEEGEDEDDGEEDDGEEEDDEDEEEDDGEDEEDDKKKIKTIKEPWVSSDEESEADSEAEIEKSESEIKKTIQNSDVKVISIDNDKGKKKESFLDKKRIIKEKLMKNKTDSFF